MSRTCWTAAVGTIALCLYGCGGGSGGFSTGDALQTGRSALNRVAAGSSTADTTTFESIIADFQLALQQNPGSIDARFGLAVCLAGEAGIDLDGGAGTATTISLPANTTSGSASLPTAPITGVVPPIPINHQLPIQPLRPRYQLSLLWNLTGSLSNPYALLNMLSPITDLRRGLLPFYGYSQDTTDLTRRQNLFRKLTTATDNLKTIEADPNFLTSLPDPYHTGQSVSVGLPEVYLFDAYLQSLRVEVALSLAYVRDPGGYQNIATPPPAPINGIVPIGAPLFAVNAPSGAFNATTIYTALDLNQDGRLTPSEYLPPSPYLTLRDPSYLNTAQQSLLAIVDRETKGIAGVLARPSDAKFLVSNTSDTQQVLTETRDHVLPLIQQAATGVVTIDFPHYYPPSNAAQAADPPPPAPGTGGVFAIPGSSGPPAPPIFLTEKVVVNLAAWFAAPPQDLKQYAPTFVLDAQGVPDETKTTYPDSTFGGLFPNGLPNDLLF